MAMITWKAGNLSAACLLRTEPKISARTMRWQVSSGDTIGARRTHFAIRPKETPYTELSDCSSSGLGSLSTRNQVMSEPAQSSLLKCRRESSYTGFATPTHSPLSTNPHKNAQSAAYDAPWTPCTGLPILDYTATPSATRLFDIATTAKALFKIVASSLPRS